MQPTTYEVITTEQVTIPLSTPDIDWVWHGYIGRGAITLFTSRWKAGKTTLLAGLLHHLAADGEFLDRPCRAAKVLVVSEESRQMWAARLKAVPIAAHTRLMLRPFPGRPTPAEWDRLVEQAEAMWAANDLDLLVVDPLASFLPGRSDSDPGTLLDLLNPLRRLAEAGVAVLILHHPRRAKSEEGSTARGSGTLLGYVDVILELHQFGSMKSDERRRRLVARSRHPDTPPAVVYEWVPGTPEFRCVADPLEVQFQDNWETLKAIMARRWEPASAAELLDDWPPDQFPPTRMQLYHWLKRAFVQRLVKRCGEGIKGNPYCYLLPSPDDLPELKPFD